MSDSEDKLHRLIHSLDKSEKGFVKKFASLHVKEDANGLKLFDIYNAVKVYNKEKIEKLVSKEKFANHLPKAKNYLFELILKALRNYYSEKKEVYSLKAQIQNADILKDKGLYKEALSIIKRAKKSGLQNELYFQLVEALYIERKIWPSYQVNPLENEKLFKLSKEEEKQYKYMDEAVAFFTNCCFKAFLYAHLMGRSNKNEVRKNYENMINSEDYNRYLYLASKKIKILHQNILVFYHYVKDDKIQFEKEAEILLHLCTNETENIAFSKEIVVGFIVNLAVASTTYYNKKLFTDCIKGLAEFKEGINDPENHAYILSTSCLHDLNSTHLMLSGEFEKALETCDKFLSKKEVLKDDALNDNLAGLYASKSVIHFLLEQFQESIKSLNAIELYTERHTSPYADSEINLIRILCHLELGNYEAAFYMAKSYRSLIEKESLVFLQRKTLIDTILKNPLAHKKEIAKITFDKIIEQNLPVDKCFDQHIINIGVWCQSAINNESLTQSYKEHYYKLYQ